MKQVIPGAYLEKNCLLIVLQHRWVFSFNRCGNVKLREVKKTQDLRSHSYLVVKPLLCLLSLFHGELSAKPSECGGSLPEFGTHAVFSPFMFFPHLGTTLSTKTTKTTQKPLMSHPKPPHSCGPSGGLHSGHRPGLPCVTHSRAL